MSNFHRRDRRRRTAAAALALTLLCPGCFRNSVRDASLKSQSAELAERGSSQSFAYRMRRKNAPENAGKTRQEVANEVRAEMKAERKSVGQQVAGSFADEFIGPIVAAPFILAAAAVTYPIAKGGEYIIKKRHERAAAINEAEYQQLFSAGEAIQSDRVETDQESDVILPASY